MEETKMNGLLKAALDTLKNQRGSIGVYFDGRRLVRPQAATRIDDSGMYARGLGGGNTLALIGECTGGEPGIVQWFTDPSYAKAILRGGSLLQAVQRAYDPSAEVSGAYLVAAIRVNPATRARLTLTDSTYGPLAVLTSLDYGIWNNQIKARIEAGTTSGTKKLTFTYGTSYDTGDNIERKSLYLGCGDPSATVATLTITQGTSTKTLATTITATPRTDTLGTVGVFYPIYTTAVAPASYALRFPTYASQYCFIGSDQPFNKVTFTVGAGAGEPNVIVSTMTAQYWNGLAWTTVAITDGTKTGGNTTLGQTGDVTFTQPSDWQHSAAATTPTGPAVDLYWLKIMVSAALTVTAVQTAIRVGRGLSVNLSSYSTIQELVDYLDAQPHYEAYAATSEPDTDLSTQLDACTATDFLAATLGSTTLTAPYSSGRILTVGATTNFGINDYITISRIDGTSEEMRRITAIGTLALTIDSALSTTYIAGSKVREAVTLKSDVQAIIDWINDGNTGYVTAAYPATTWVASTAYIVGDVVLPSTASDKFYVCSVAGTSGTTEPTWSGAAGTVQPLDGTMYWVCRTASRGAIQNIADTYLLGGSEGTTTQTHWDTALETLQAEDTQLISCVSYDASVWAALSSHCSYMSTVGKKERIGFCGGFTTADGYTDGLGKWTSSALIANSITQMETYANQLNTDRMVYVGPGFKSYDENGLLYTYNGAIAAALVSGMAAGVDVAEALTHKTIKVVGLEYNLKWANLDSILEAGVCPLEYEPGFGYRVCQSITTWIRNDKYNRREVSVRRTADYVARQVRDRLDRDFVGTKGTITTLISIKNAVISTLQQMYRAELLAGDATNPPFKNIQCRLEGDTCWVDFECSPVIPINYIPIVIHLTVYTATVTA